MNELVILERRRNRIIKIEDGVAHIDVSTRQYANMITQIDEDDIPLILDGPVERLKRVKPVATQLTALL